MLELSEGKLLSIIQFVFRTHAEKMEASLVGAMLDDDIKATGQGLNSIGSEIENYTLSILGEEYLKDVDKGQPPGTVVDINSLITWVDARGLAPAENVESYAYGVQQAIYKRGTIKRFGYEGANFLNYIIEQDVPELVNDLELRLGDEIEKVIARKINKNGK